MSQIYYAYQIATEDEIVLALLSQFSFESFEEKEGEIVGYIARDKSKLEHADIERLLVDRNITYSVEEIKPRNWNEEWEKSFQPVKIDNFLMIRADFHPHDASYDHDIIINPKMAFGTGHHETTYMMSLMMREIDFQDKVVFDYGCGTGILSILASQLGASKIHAIDIEEPSYHNTIENAEINRIDNIEAHQATLETFDGDGYDIILANINRTVLLNSADDLLNRLKSDGYILLSGILREDESLIMDRYTTAGFKSIKKLERGNWLCFLMQK